MLKNGLFFKSRVENENLVCFKGSKMVIEFCDASEEGNDLYQFLIEFAVQITKEVLYHDGNVYKFCGIKEYRENIKFLKDNPEVTPILVDSDDTEFIIITRFMKGYKNLKQIEPKSLNRSEFESALKKSLSRLNGNYFMNDLLNLSNIGYNGKDVIFFEQSGEMNQFENKEDMIRVFMDRVENEDKKYKKLFS